MFTAANPHAKNPAQIQECCLNPGLDTATGISPPQQLQQRGLQGQGCLRGRTSPPGQIIPGVQHRGLCSRAPSRAVGPISWEQTQGHRGSASGWDGPEQGLGELLAAESPEGLGGGWEAKAKLRGDPQWGHRAAADPVLTLGCTFTWVWYPHPLVTLAKHHTQDLAPFLSFPFYSLSTQRCPPGPLGTATLTLPGAIAPQTPSPAPRAQSHLPRGSPPWGGSPGGSHQHDPSRGEAERGAGLQLCLKLWPPSLAQRRKPQTLSQRGHFSKAETCSGLLPEHPRDAGAPALLPSMGTARHTWAGGKRKVSHPVPAIAYEPGIGIKWREIVLRKLSPAGEGEMERIGGGNKKDLGSEVFFGSIVP